MRKSVRIGSIWRAAYLPWILCAMVLLLLSCALTRSLYIVDLEQQFGNGHGSPAIYVREQTEFAAAYLVPPMLLLLASIALISRNRQALMVLLINGTIWFLL